LSLERSCGSLWSPLVTFLGVIISRGVHGSVRFVLDSKNQPNRITVFLYKINRTNQPGPVKSSFLRKKPGNLIPLFFFFVFFLNWLSLTLN
jgi:hypothetical protein